MWGGTTITTAARKAAAAGIPVNPEPVPARFILHTDLEDAVPPPPVDDVIELPPQYSERRVPLPGFEGEAGASGSGARSTMGSGKNPLDFAPPPPPPSGPPPPPPGSSRS